MQASSISTMRAGLYAEQITGIGLNSDGRQTLRDGQAEAEALAQAVREAITRARNAGLDAFAPDSAMLQVPGVSVGDLRVLFAKVVGLPYRAADQNLIPGLREYGPLTLAQWSQEADMLASYVAQQGSMLPPGEGGGLRHALGHWYINGERYTLADLFLTVRMGTLEQTDKALGADLDTLLTNTNLARELLAVLADMKRRRDLKEAAVVPPDPAPEGFRAATAAVFNARTDFQAFVEASKLSLTELMGYGTRFKASSDAPSYLQTSGEAAQASGTLSSADYGFTMDELQALFDSVNAENQVKRLKVQSVQNARTAVLEGMSAFLSSTSDQNSKVGRNL